MNFKQNRYLSGKPPSMHMHIIRNSLARKLSKPDDGRYRPKHVVFYC